MQRYESFDCWRQDGLVGLAAGQSVFLDIGANIRVMTLAVQMLVALRESGAAIATLDGRPCRAATPASFDNLVARWSAS
jgi:hypothetical protein